MKKQERDRLLVSVTYRCNASCPYCYIGSFKKRFPKDMGFFTFLDIVNHFIKNGGKKIYIIGGEPVLWKHINRAVKYCRLRGVETTVFTNALEVMGANPDEAYINLTYYFSQPDRILRALAEYKKRKARIILRYNITAEEAHSREFRMDKAVDEVAKLALKFGAMVHVTPISPFDLSKDVGRNLYGFCETIVSRGIKCVIPDPIPPCVFSEEERAYLKKNCKLYYKCGLGYLPLIHPDGITVQPCARMFFPKSLGSLDCIGQVKDLYVKESEKLENDVASVCRECEYFKKKQCCGGCMVSRFEKRKECFL